MSAFAQAPSERDLHSADWANGWDGEVKAALRGGGLLLAAEIETQD